MGTNDDHICQVCKESYHPKYGGSVCNACLADIEELIALRTKVAGLEAERALIYEALNQAIGCMCAVRFVKVPNADKALESGISEAKSFLDSLPASAKALAELEKSLRRISIQKTEVEWRAYAKEQGWDPNDGNYASSYDAIIHDARAALAKLDAAHGKE